MGKGRAPCCDKSQVKRGPWSPSEDLRLITFIQKHGHHNWRALPNQAGLLRCGKSCRLRWINYLRPDVKRGNFSKEEEDTIIKLHQALGNKFLSDTMNAVTMKMFKKSCASCTSTLKFVWAKIASYLPGRTDNEIKNIWNTHLKKRLSQKSNVTDHQADESPKESSSRTSSCSSSSVTSVSCGRRNIKPDSTEHDEVKHIDHQEGNSANELEKPKEILSPSISCDNLNSNALNLENDQQMDRSFDMGGTYSETNGAMQEVNKPDLLEIPLESDVDFWSMLDGFDPFESSNSQMRLQGASAEDEDEHIQWFQYLENELVLEGQNYHDYPLAGAEEVDATMGYFRPFPSSAHSSSGI